MNGRRIRYPLSLLESPLTCVTIGLPPRQCDRVVVVSSSDVEGFSSSEQVERISEGGGFVPCGVAKQQIVSPSNQGSPETVSCHQPKSRSPARTPQQKSEDAGFVNSSRCPANSEALLCAFSLSPSPPPSLLPPSSLLSPVS